MEGGRRRWRERGSVERRKGVEEGEREGGEEKEGTLNGGEREGEEEEGWRMGRVRRRRRGKEKRKER